MQRAVTINAIILLLFNGIGAVYGGLNFIIHTDGSSLGMSVAHLNHSLFSSYLIPGIVLLVVNGLFSFVTIGLTLAGTRHHPVAIILQGVLLSGWLVIQIIILRFVFILHLVMGMVGLLLIASGVYLYLKNRKIS